MNGSISVTLVCALAACGSARGPSAQTTRAETDAHENRAPPIREGLEQRVRANPALRSSGAELRGKPGK